MKKNLVLFVAFVMTLSLTVNSQESIKNFKGHWKYECNEAPDGYKTGAIIIEQKNNTPMLTVKYKDGTKNNANSIKVKSGILFFTMEVEGGFIEVKLNKVGEKLKGTVSSNDGVLGIVAIKEK